MSGAKGQGLKSPVRMPPGFFPVEMNLAGPGRRTRSIAVQAAHVAWVYAESAKTTALVMVSRDPMVTIVVAHELIDVLGLISQAHSSRVVAYE